MVIIPDSTVVVDGLSFTIGQITWTTGINSFTTTTMEEAQIRSASTTSSLATALTTLATALTTPAMALTTLATTPTTPEMALTTPTTRRPLPCYNGTMINNTDLIEAIDQVGHKLSQP
jgi:hypothetical protein